MRRLGTAHGPDRSVAESQMSHMIWLRKSIVKLCCLAGIVLFTTLVNAPIMAQEPPGDWSPAAMIVQSDQRIKPGALVADPVGHLHLFFVAETMSSGSGSINYMHWDGEEWSEPVDIILTAGGSNPGTLRAAIDGDGTLHLLWVGPGRNLYYASAPSAAAGSARSWSAPRTIGTTAAWPDIIADSDGTLFVAFVDEEAGGSVSLISSSDGGSTWSTARSISQTSRNDAAIGEIRIAEDGAGRLHAAWTEYQLPNGWPPLGAFYSRSVDRGETWTPPLQVAEEGHGQIGVDAAGENDVHLVWRSTIGGDGSFHQWSGDGGQTWAILDRADDGGGFSGLPSFAVDSQGKMHFVLGYSLYAFWDGSRLSPYQDLKTHDVLAHQSSGELALLGITTGNRLHVVYETDFKYLWYTSKFLDTPAMPTATPMLIKSSTVMPIVVQVESTRQPLESTVEPRPTPPLVENRTAPAGLSPNETLAIGILPPLLTVLAVISVYLLYKRKE